MTNGRRTKTTIAALALVAALATAPAVAGPMHHGPGHDGPGEALGPVGQILHGLDLSADQRERIHEILDGARDGELGEAMRAMRDARRNVEVLVWTPGTPEADLLAAADAAAQAARSALLARAAIASSVLEVLDEEQRAEVADRLQNPPEERPRFRRHRPRGRR